jgi:hypothetical protein
MGEPDGDINPLLPAHAFLQGFEEIAPGGEPVVRHRVRLPLDPRLDQGQLHGQAKVPDITVAEAPAAVPGDEGDAPFASPEDVGAGHAVVRPEDVAGSEDDGGETPVRVLVAEFVFCPDLVPHIGHERRRPAAPILRDVAAEPERQGRRDVNEPPQGRAKSPEPPDEISGYVKDVLRAFRIAGHVGHECRGVDDVCRPGRQVDILRKTEIALDQLDVESGQVMEVRGFPDERVDLPAPFEEPAAKVGADEAVGSGEQDAAHAAPPLLLSVHRFQAPAIDGAARRTTTAAAIPMTESER